MKLGQLIKRLEACDPTATVTFDFCSLSPRKLDSWRGIYSELALGWHPVSSEFPSVSVAGLLAELRQAIGNTYCGWKGGDYTMGAGTEVWVDNPGEYTNTAISGVIEVSESHVVIETRSEWS